MKVVLNLLFLTISLIAGHLEPADNFNHNLYKIIQNGHQVGYAGLGFDSGEVILSVINTTKTRKYVTVECEFGGGMSMYVNPGSLKKVKGVGFIVKNAQEFRITRHFCGYSAIKINFKNFK